MLVEQGSRVNFEKGNSYLEWKGKRLPLLERNGVYLVNLTDFVAADTALGLMDKDHEYEGDGGDPRVHGKPHSHLCEAQSHDQVHSE